MKFDLIWVCCALLIAGCGEEPPAYKGLASKVFEARCKTDARQTISKEIEGVRGILQVEISNPGSFLNGGDRTSYLLGLEFVEQDAHDPIRHKSRGKYVRRGMTDARTTTYSDERKSTIGLSFENIGSIEEEIMGIQSRRIRVYDLRTNETYAERIEFLNFDKRCPCNEKDGCDQIAFMARAINPKSYGCLAKERIPTTTQSDTGQVWACHKKYWESKPFG